MAEDRNDPLADLFTLFAAPLSGTMRSLDQFRKGVDEFLKGVENFNRTMANLNETTERINSLLADVEEPIRAVIPQVTRTVKVADEMMQVVSGPAMAVAPALNRLADTLSTPAFDAAPVTDRTVLRPPRRGVAPPQPADAAGRVGRWPVRRIPGAGDDVAPAAPPPPRTIATETKVIHTPTPPAEEGRWRRRRRPRRPREEAPAKKAPTKKRAAKKAAPKSLSQTRSMSEIPAWRGFAHRSRGQRVTKGVSTTVPDTGLPRTSMTTVVPRVGVRRQEGQRDAVAEHR